MSFEASQCSFLSNMQIRSAAYRIIFTSTISLIKYLPLSFLYTHYSKLTSKSFFTVRANLISSYLSLNHVKYLAKNNCLTTKFPWPFWVQKKKKKGNGFIHSETLSSRIGILYYAEEYTYYFDITIKLIPT